MAHGLRVTLALLALAAAAAAAVVGAAADFTASCPPPCECRWQSGNKAAACAGAGLTAVPERLSDDIQNLELSDNPLRHLPADAFRRAGLANLKKIALRSCRLESVHRAAFAGLGIAIELDLSRNLLRALHADTFRATSRLRRVNLAANLLEALPDDLFRDLAFLQRVELGDNRLARVGARSFHNLPRLQALRLDGNRLATLRPDALRSLANLSSLELHRNPWRCDCHLQPFRDWVLERNLYTAPTACAAPPALAGRLWLDLDSASFACRPTILEPAPDATLRARGENVTLACKVVGSPAPRVAWRFNSRAVAAGGERRYVLAEDAVDLVRWLNVTIVRARAADRGSYTCVAENVGGRDERNVTLVLALAGDGLPDGAAAVVLGGACAAALVCGALLAAWCCVPCGRGGGGGGGKRLLKADGRAGSGETPAEAGPEPDKCAANPVAKPPRLYDAPPPLGVVVVGGVCASAGGATEMCEINRTLLDARSVRASPEECPRPPAAAPPAAADAYPPDLLSFPPRARPPEPLAARFRSPLPRHHYDGVGLRVSADGGAHPPAGAGAGAAEADDAPSPAPGTPLPPHPPHPPHPPRPPQQLLVGWRALGWPPSCELTSHRPDSAGEKATQV